MLCEIRHLSKYCNQIAWEYASLSRSRSCKLGVHVHYCFSRWTIVCSSFLKTWNCFQWQDCKWNGGLAGAEGYDFCIRTEARNASFVIHFSTVWTCIVVTLEVNMVVSQKVGNWSTSRPSYTTLGHIPKACFILPQGHLLNYVLCGFIHNSPQKLQTPWMPLNRRMDKENVHLHSSVFFAV